MLSQTIEKEVVGRICSAGLDIDNCALENNLDADSQEKLDLVV